jgi:hypothetical protein
VVVKTFKDKLVATGGFLQFCTFRLKVAGGPDWCLGRVSPGEEPFPRWGHPNHSPIMASFLANQSIFPCQSEQNALPIRASFLANLSIIPCPSEHHSLPIRASFLANLSIILCQSEHLSLPL